MGGRIHSEACKYLLWATASDIKQSPIYEDWRNVWKRLMEGSHHKMYYLIVLETCSPWCDMDKLTGAWVWVSLLFPRSLSMQCKHECNRNVSRQWPQTFVRGVSYFSTARTPSPKSEHFLWSLIKQPITNQHYFWRKKCHLFWGWLWAEMLLDRYQWPHWRVKRQNHRLLEQSR